MKNVLIPTDYTVESIKIIEALIFSKKCEQVNFVFVHAFKISDSITDLLMLSRRSKDYEHISDEFYTALNQCKSKYAKEINNIRLEYFYGNTVAAFKNFLDALNIDHIAYAKDHQFSSINKYSINPKYLTERAGCATIELDTTLHPLEEKLFDTKIPQENINSLTA